jgi:hypothetical protein
MRLAASSLSITSGTQVARATDLGKLAKIVGIGGWVKARQDYCAELRAAESRCSTAVGSGGRTSARFGATPEAPPLRRHSGGRTSRCPPKWRERMVPVMTQPRPDRSLDHRCHVDSQARQAGGRRASLVLQARLGKQANCQDAATLSIRHARNESRSGAYHSPTIVMPTSRTGKVAPTFG